MDSYNTDLKEMIFVLSFHFSLIFFLYLLKVGNDQRILKTESKISFVVNNTGRLLLTCTRKDTIKKRHTDPLAFLSDLN